jgi:hypothetical protein
MSIKKPHLGGDPSQRPLPPPATGRALPYPSDLILSYQTKGRGETSGAGKRRNLGPETTASLRGNGENQEEDF